MRLNELLKEQLLKHGIDGADEASVMTTLASIDIVTLSVDSRLCDDQTAFVALQGLQVHGREFIHAAFAQGSKVALVDGNEFKIEASAEAVIITLPDLQQDLARLCDQLYGDINQQLVMCAVTGTNGKTTTAHLLAQALDLLGHACAYIGTVGIGRVQKLKNQSLTTPDYLSIRAWAKVFFDQSVSHLAIEASSHALSQNRLTGLKINTAILTNISHDHLDYHASMDVYANAKASLFSDYDISNAVINLDSDYASLFLQKSTAKNNVTYSRLDKNANVYLSNVQYHLEGLELEVMLQEQPLKINSRLIGDVNVENILALIASLHVLGIAAENIAQVIPLLVSVPGRMEVFNNPSQSTPVVLVDYAHTPDALEKVLKSVILHQPKHIYCVFGCGGDRDKSKRSIMGAIAEKYADYPIVTNDNPRSESPADIVKDIISGMKSDPYVEYDRSAAISYAVHQAQNDDIVVVAGKGHEDYQILAQGRIDYSDRDLVKQLVEHAV